jgi:predicted nucleotidyltransferase
MAKFQDFKDILKLLKEKKAKYLIIGGNAVNFYSRMKLTEDLDIWVKPSPENAKAVFEALNEFGYGNLDISESDFIKEDNIVQLGFPPVRIDFMTTVEGFEFDEAYVKRKRGYLFGIQNVPFISYDDLVKNKKLAGRPKDKFDIWWLKQYSNPKKR